MGKQKDKDEEKKSSRWDWLEVIADLIQISEQDTSPSISLG